MPRYEYRPFEYVTPPELSGVASSVAPVAIIGAGPVGLTLAIDLALHGVKCVVLDDNNVVSHGSRAICWAKRTLEIFDRLGVGQKMLKKGVTWKAGRLFHRDSEVYSFDLQPEEGYAFPAFINLQQYYVEQYLVERAGDFPDLIDLRFNNRVTGHQGHNDGVTVEIETPDGNYNLDCQWLVACDGARSPTRERMGLAFPGQAFEEQFLICDIEMDESPFVTKDAERWFWFEPNFHDGQSALLHKQPDNIYRIDLQLGSDADVETEKNPENVTQRIRRVVGDRPFTLDWMSIYRFTCARLERFVHERVIFCGDSAHVVSPFGARGGNGGIQDADNLGWKLAAVLKEVAGTSLIESYDEERQRGADENIGHSARATNFMTPKSQIEAMFRDEVLHLARKHPFARRLINSGRLSVPCVLEGGMLQTLNDEAPLACGSAAPDAPLRSKEGQVWLLEQLGGAFKLLSVGYSPDLAEIGLDHVVIAPDGKFSDTDGWAAQRYGEGWTYLIRPDQHVAAAFRTPNSQEIIKALNRARRVPGES